MISNVNCEWNSCIANVIHLQKDKEGDLEVQNFAMRNRSNLCHEKDTIKDATLCNLRERPQMSCNDHQPQKL